MKKEFKIRCSGIGQIMTNPKTKKAQEAGELSQTAKTFCETWLKEQLYNRKKEIDTKYMQKGLIVEDESIDFVAQYYGYGIIIKNEKFFENDFMTGTPDVILDDKVVDVKNSWDCFTFPLFNEELSKDYYWQLQGYMELTGKDKAEVIYTLCDTPDHLIESEAHKKARFEGYDVMNIMGKMQENMTYGDIPEYLKIKNFSFKKNKEDIESIKEQVIKCRKYIETLTDSI